MKVKKLCTLITVFAFLAIFSLAGVQAADENAAKVTETGTEYATFEAAISAAETGQTVELLQNAEFSGGMTIDKNLTIDGKGFTLTDSGAASANAFSIKITADTVTVKDITLERTEKKANGFFFLSGSGKLVLSGKTVINKIEGSNGAAVWAESNDASCGLTIQGREVKITECNAYWGIIALRGNTYATIEYVEITKENDTANRNAIGMSNNPKLTIDGGLIKGYKKAGIGIGNYDGAIGAALMATIGNGVTIDACTIGVEVGNSAKGSVGSVEVSGTIKNCTTAISMNGSDTGAKVSVTGGTIQGNTTAVNVISGTVNVSGGTISGNNRVVNSTGGTVNIADGYISGASDMIYANADAAAINISGGTIESTGVSVNANKGSVSISGGKINAGGSAVYISGATVEINGGTIASKANGVSLASGTLNMKNGTIENCATGIKAAGGTANVSGGTIQGCTYGIEGKAGNVNMTNGTIQNCGNLGSGAGIYVYKTGALNVNISGGTISENQNGVQLVGNGDTATISGTVDITNNTNNIFVPGNCYLYLSGKFTGKIGIKTGANDDARMANNVKATDDFTGLANLGCITNDWNGSRFGYYNGTTFGWTKHPEPAASTDSGIYRTEEGGENLGVIRFITEFSAENAEAIEYAGLYALNADTVKAAEIPDGTKFERFDNGFAAGKNAYAVDVINISRINFEKPVTGVVFVKIKGVETPVYLVVSGAKVNTDKYLGISAGSDFAAQEVTE